jgi:hypothetical protein
MQTLVEPLLQTTTQFQRKSETVGVHAIRECVGGEREHLLALDKRKAIVLDVNTLFALRDMLNHYTQQLNENGKGLT